MKKIWLIALLFIALLTRIIFLDLRPIDHDESAHAWIALKQVIEYPNYQYDPAFHGPFLYFLISLSFLVLGDSDFSARLPVALFSILGVFFALKFDRWLGRSAYLFAIFMLISPSILYYSRYARDDIIGISSFIAVLYFYLRYRETQKVFYAIALSLFLAVIFTAKENWVQYFGVFFLAIIFERALRKDFNLDFRALIPSILVFILFSSFLYSSAFAYAIHGKNWLEVMFNDEWVRRFIDHSLPYWLSQGVVHLATPLAFLSSFFAGKEVFENKNFKLTYLIGLSATIIVSPHVTYVDFNNVDQPLIYVQTQWGALEMADRIRELLEEGNKVAVFAVNTHYWSSTEIMDVFKATKSLESMSLESGGSFTR